MSGPTVGALFAGYGGLELAVHDVFGARPLWFSEVDAAPSRILAHHWPDVPNLGDITKIQWSDVEPVDIITAGYPCQPFSHAGARKGAEDARHLWPHVVEAVSTMRPPTCIFENVQGHLTLGFDQVLRDLHLLGYDTYWTLIAASSVGAPHRRNRLFIFAEDAHGQLRGGTHRRRGVHRDPVVGRLVPGAAQGHDDRQGDAGPAEDAPGLRREDRRPTQGDRDLSRLLQLAPDGNGGVEPDRAAPASPVGQGRPGGHRSRVPGDGRPVAATAERSGDVDGGDAGAGRGVRPADPAREPDGSGRPSTEAPERDADCGLQVGCVVGAGAGPVRPGGVRGPTADVGVHGGGARLLDDLTLLPSPRTSDTNGAGVHGQGGMDLRTAVSLLPTPTSMDYKASGSAAYASTDTHQQGTTLTDATVRQPEMFGQYASAIARWEALTRPAPAPAEPTGKGGAHRLSPAFVEWMMGLPLGHVTKVPGLSRNDQLKALGNGVVPQQAAAAIRHLLTMRSTVEEAA